MARRAHPPAWYPDPRNPARLRRWDGRAWTAETRAFPDWLRPLRLSPGPARRPPSRTRPLWFISAILLTLAGTSLWVVERSGANDHDRIDDATFVRAANSVCRTTADTTYAENATPARGRREADRIDALADGWDDMVAHLRMLPVRPLAGPKVTRWLRSWDAWIAVSHGYAGAVRKGDTADAARILREGARFKQSVDRFAYVNGINRCLFP